MIKRLICLLFVMLMLAPPAGAMSVIIRGGGSGTADGTGNWTATGVTSVQTVGNVGVGVTVPSGLFQVGTASMTVLANGNVGIGTTAPGNRLVALNAGGGTGLVYDATYLSNTGGLSLGAATPAAKMYTEFNFGGTDGIQARNLSSAGYVYSGIKGDDNVDYAELILGNASAADTDLKNRGLMRLGSGLTSGFGVAVNGSNTSVLVVSTNGTVNVTSNLLGLYTRTTAQIAAIAPPAVGMMLYNSDLAEICVSTGTSAGMFKREAVSIVTGLPLGCN